MTAQTSTVAAAAVTTEAAAPEDRSGWLRQLARDKIAVVAATILGIVVTAAV